MDDRLYFYCCGCCRLALRESAVRSEGLHGIFCTEECALICHRVNGISIPETTYQMQMDSGESVPDQDNGREEDPTQPDDFRAFPEWD